MNLKSSLYAHSTLFQRHNQILFLLVGISIGWLMPTIYLESGRYFSKSSNICQGTNSHQILFDSSRVNTISVFTFQSKYPVQVRTTETEKRIEVSNFAKSSMCIFYPCVHMTILIHSSLLTKMSWAQVQEIIFVIEKFAFASHFEKKIIKRITC